MIRFEFTVAVDRPIEAVFAYLTDAEKLPMWQSMVVEAHQDTEGPPQEGARITEVRNFLGRRIESTVEVTALEPDRRLDLRVVKGPVPFSVSHTLESTDGGTTITVVGQGEPGGFFKLAEPIVGRTAQRQLKSDFQTLKDILETNKV